LLTRIALPKEEPARLVSGLPTGRLGGKSEPAGPFFSPGEKQIHLELTALREE
jgi:hypothetical protein